METVILFEALVAFLQATLQLVAAIGGLLGNNLALVLFVAYALFAIRWPDVWEQLSVGGWAAFGLLYVVAAMVYLLCTPAYEPIGIGPPEWEVFILGVAKFLTPAAFLAIAFLCGRIQELMEVTPPEYEFAAPPEPAGGHGHGHGSDDH